MPDQHFIGNRWVASASRQAIPVIDPSDGQQYDEIARGNAEDIQFAVQTARTAFEGEWSVMSAAERGRLLYRLSQALIEHGEEFAQIEARDCGKPLRQARADAAAVARYFEFYAGACDKL
ncbi:MAG TPA: aldehyde dehydrogenase family protein, partial [Noviherbaspirillum sp.]